MVLRLHYFMHAFIILMTDCKVVCSCCFLLYIV